MDELAFVEVLDGAGQVVARHRLDRLPAVIGRAYESDVVLDDPYVSPLHARLSRDESGALVLDDLGSVNGIVDGPGSVAQGSVALGPDRVVRLGRTAIRVRRRGDPVAPALRDIPAPPPAAARAERSLVPAASRVGSPGITLLIALATAAVFVLDSWLGNTGRVTGAELVSEVAGVFAMLALWAGCWAFASRLLTGRFRFPAHFAVACIAMAVTILFYVATGYLAYVAPPEGGQAMFGLVAGIGLFAALLHAHLGFATTLSRRRRSGISLGIAVTLTLLVGLGALSEADDFDTTLDYAGNIKPLGGGWVRTVTLDRFLEETKDLRMEVDEMAKEADSR